MRPLDRSEVGNTSTLAYAALVFLARGALALVPALAFAFVFTLDLPLSGRVAALSSA